MKNNKIFIIWSIIVVLIVIMLTILGFTLKNKTNKYTPIEEKLEEKAKQYVDKLFLYPENKGGKIKVTSIEMIEEGTLDELKLDDDTCTGYVIITNDNVYKYDTYIKCSKYTTSGYDKNK